MNVLMVNPSGSAFGYVHPLCDALAAAGHAVTLMTGPIWPRCLAGLPTPRYRHEVAFYRRTWDASRAPSGWRRRLGRAARLAEHAAGWARVVAAAPRFDVVHVQWLPVPPLDLAPLALLSRRALVYTVHDLYPHELVAGDRPPGPLDRALWRAVYATPSALIAHTDDTAARLTAELAVAPERVTVLSHGDFSYLRAHAPPSAPPPPTDLLFFGLVGRYKGLDVLLRALPSVRAALPGVGLRVVGRPHGDLAPERALIAELGLADAVDLRLGWVDEAAIPGHFAAARVVVLPYRRISQSGVAVAALTFGRPVVASDVGGVGELVRASGGGLLVAPEDPVALASALVEVLSHDAVAAALGASGRAWADRALAWGPIAARTAEVYAAARPRWP